MRFYYGFRRIAGIGEVENKASPFMALQKSASGTDADS
jgi:hypothetical protein